VYHVQYCPTHTPLTILTHLLTYYHFPTAMASASTFLVFYTVLAQQLVARIGYCHSLEGGGGADCAFSKGAGAGARSGSMERPVPLFAERALVTVSAEVHAVDVACGRASRADAKRLLTTARKSGGAAVHVVASLSGAGAAHVSITCRGMQATVLATPALQLCRYQSMTIFASKYLCFA
jgi:hypothetical protein